MVEYITKNKLLERDDSGKIDYLLTARNIGAKLLGTYDEAKRAESVGIEVGEKYRDDFQRAEDTARHGIFHGLLLDEKGKMNMLEKLGFNYMNLQKDEDKTGIKSYIKNLIALGNTGEESNIDVNNNKFSVALRRKMIAEGNPSEEDFIDRVVNIVQDLRKGKESPEVDGLKLRLSLGLLDEPIRKRYKENILGGPTPYSDELNPAPNVGVVESTKIPPKRPKELEFNKGGDTPKQVENKFDPEGDGYDFKTAKEYGIKPDKNGHYQSRVPETGMILKGRKHPTFDKTIEADKKLGYQIVKGTDGRYYSFKKSLAMAEGGATMEKQMELFGGMGGLKDDGMNRDPISGNEVPSGSMAEEVRDDIPAQLSDGEYVVPADVVRFFGVKFFEDLRMQAKMGLSQMERTGRIGGEPVAVEDDMLDPKDEQAIRIMMMGNEGGVVKAAEGFDFSKDAASKADPLKPFQSFVGSTYFDAPTTKEIIDGVKDGVVNYYHPDGRIQPVRYKDGKLVNPEDEQYTTGQWSTTPPTSEEKTQETRISTDRRDERESSNRERDTGGRDFQQPEMESAESTETLAKRIGGTALYSDAEKTKPLYMTESGYRNLSAEYDRLGLEKKGTSFAEYNNLPMMTKIQMSFGRDYSQSDIAKILDKANETPSILQFGLLGAILKPFIDKMGTADKEGMRKFEKETPKGFDPYEFFNNDGEFNAQAYYDKIGEGTLLGTTRMDRVLLGIPSNVTPQQLARIEANRVRATDPKAAMKRMKDAAKQFTYEGILEKEERAGKGLTGDLDTVAENEAFEQRMKEARDAAGRQPTIQSGPNTGSDNDDGNQSGTGGQTSGFGYQPSSSNINQSVFGSDPEISTGYSTPSTPSYTTSNIPTGGGGFVPFDKGGLASKPKAKPKRKKNTKGLGTKPKAT